jgi:hypothetical protein
MAKNSPRQSSGISRPLIIGLGVAGAFAALMAGWFVLTVSSGGNVSTEVATPADAPAGAPVHAPRL